MDQVCVTPPPLSGQVTDGKARTEGEETDSVFT